MSLRITLAVLAWLRMLWFQVRQFARVGYFIQLMVVSTLSAALLQRLVAGSSVIGSPVMDPSVWLRTAEIGLWTTCTAAAGIIGMQRWQGTFTPLLVGQKSAAQTLSALVGAASTFGLLAFPLSAVLTWVLGGGVNGASGVSVTWQTVLGALLAWLGALSMSFVIAAIFVLSRNATTYEVLILVPVLLLSGIFGFPSWIPSSVAAVSLIFPFTGGVQYLAASVGAADIAIPDWGLVLAGLLCTALWMVLAHRLLTICLRRAERDGTLGIG